MNSQIGNVHPLSTKLYSMSCIINFNFAGSHVIFECTGISSSPVEVTVNVTLYSEVTGERFCPISFMFGKECLDESEENCSYNYNNFFNILVMETFISSRLT